MTSHDIAQVFMQQDERRTFATSCRRCGQLFTFQRADGDSTRLPTACSVRCATYQPATPSTDVLTEEQSFVLGVLDNLPSDKHAYGFEELVKLVAERAPPPPRDEAGNDVERDTRYFRYGTAIDGLIKKKLRVRRQGSMLVIS